jgi:hypothetical protein
MVSRTSSNRRLKSRNSRKSGKKILIINGERRAGVEKSYHNGGATVIELINAGYKVPEIKALGLTLEGLNRDDFNEWKLSPIRTILKLQRLGFTVKNLIDMKFLINDVAYGNYQLGDLINSGFTLKDILEHNETILNNHELAEKEDYFGGEKYTKESLKKAAIYLKNYGSELIRYLPYEPYTFLTNLFSVKDLSNLTYDDVIAENKMYTLKDYKEYITNRNLSNFFANGLLTYGETKMMYNVYLTELTKLREQIEKARANPTLSVETAQKKEWALSDMLDKLENQLDTMKKTCKNKIKKNLFASNTNPECKLNCESMNKCVDITPTKK